MSNSNDSMPAGEITEPRERIEACTRTTEHSLSGSTRDGAASISVRDTSSARTKATQSRTAPSPAVMATGPDAADADSQSDPHAREIADRLALRPIKLAEALEFCRAHHRHSQPPVGHRFSIGAEAGGVLVGAAIVGRPVARMADDGYTAEVLRCVTDGHPNACSMLYGAARRAAKAMGYRRLITYTLSTEPGTSLRAAGWEQTAYVPAQTWSRRTRLRDDKHVLMRRTRWEVAA